MREYGVQMVIAKTLVPLQEVRTAAGRLNVQVNEEPDWVEVNFTSSSFLKLNRRVQAFQNALKNRGYCQEESMWQAHEVTA